MNSSTDTPRPARFPVLALLDPREHTRAVVATLAVGLVLWGVVVWGVGMPIWGATSIVLGMLLVPGARKWRSDLRRWGATATVLGILLTLQGFHSIEHLAQWVQFHFLHWAPGRSSGLLSAADAEWVHFVWNWGVVAVVAALMSRGMRNAWAWLLLGWATAHALEHAYMLWRYLELLRELEAQGTPHVSAQGLPGVLGRDGLLARGHATHGTVFGMLPAVTTLNRLDIHFWWNTGETLLLLAAGHAYLRRRFG